MGMEIPIFKAPSRGERSFVSTLVLLVCLAAVDDEGNGDDMLVLVHTVHYAPIAHPITPISGQWAFQPLDVGMFVRVAPQLVKAAVQPSDQRSIGGLVEPLRVAVSKISYIAADILETHHLPAFGLLDGTLEGLLKAGDAQQLGGRLTLLAFLQVGQEVIGHLQSLGR